MTNTIIESNGSKWMGEEPDSIERLCEVLSTKTLDPTFEDYGNFIGLPDDIEFIGKFPELEGMTLFHGNFWDVSHVFRIWTNDEEVIKKLTKLIRKNQERPEYLEASKKVTFSIHSQLVRAGIKTSGYCSDLYAEVNEVSQRIIDGYKWKDCVTTFRSNIDGKLWFDIPFAFDKFVQKKAV